MLDFWKNIDYDTERQLLEKRYAYPNDLDFSPDSELSERIIKKLLDYGRMGYESTDANICEYEKIDQILDGFMPADEVDRLRKQQDDRKPINVVMGMLYSHQQIFLTAMHRAFFSSDTFHRYAGTGAPERMAKASLAEKLIARISTWFCERDSFDIHCGDGFAYGRAFMWGKWTKKMGPNLVTEQLDADLAMALNAMGMPAEEGQSIRYLDEEDQIKQEGTEWIPLDPYQVLTDPNTPAGKLQRANFFGWMDDTDALLLLGAEDDPEEELFNCEHLEILARKGMAMSSLWRDTAARSKKMENRTDTSRVPESTRCHVMYMFVRLIPMQWGIGESKKPEIWFFAVAGDKILIKAHQVRTSHGGIPAVECAPNRRGHQINPTSNLQISYGKQIAIDFYAKQHMDYQDLVKNGKFIFDPAMLEWRNFAQGGGPMGIPMKKAARGKDINSYYQQIKTDNVTADNWNSIANLLGLAEKVDGISESARDMPERPTAAGISAIEGKSLSRMARIALLIDEQSRQQMARQHIHNAAQWMSTEHIIGFTGRDDEIFRTAYALPDGATGLAFDQWDIDPDMEIIPLAAMSQGPKNLSAMTEFGKTMLAIPQVQMEFVNRFRFDEFLTTMFREMGVFDVDWFKTVNMTTGVNDQALLAAAQQGNMVPMRQAIQEVSR